MDQVDSARLDRWLWAARFFKTRTDAALAVRAGHVLVNERRARPAKALRISDILRIKKGSFTHKITILKLIEKRVAPTLASQAYVEDPMSVERRNALVMSLRLQPSPVREHRGRPDKKERRLIERMRYGREGS